MVIFRRYSDDGSDQEGALDRTVATVVFWRLRWFCAGVKVDSDSKWFVGSAVVLQVAHFIVGRLVTDETFVAKGALLVLTGVALVVTASMTWCCLQIDLLRRLCKILKVWSIFQAQLG